MSEDRNPFIYPASEDQNPGMTLRDYFAAHAPISVTEALKAYGGASMPTTDAGRLAFMDTWAFLRYEYADAMIAMSKVSA